MIDIGEVAKAVGASETAALLIKNMLDVPTKKIGELLGDCVSHWQWCNRINIAEKAYRKLQEKNIDPRALPPSFAVPLLRDAGDVEDEFLQDLWAALITSATADDRNVNIAFVDILHSMNPSDAIFLDAVLRTQHAGRDGRIEAVMNASTLTQEQATMSSHNLARLGLFNVTGNRLIDIAFFFLEACGSDQTLIEGLREKQKLLPHNLLSE